MPEMKFKVGDDVCRKSGEKYAVVVEADTYTGMYLMSYRDGSSGWIEADYIEEEYRLLTHTERLVGVKSKKEEFSSQILIEEECDSIKAMMLEKNRKYKDSALKPIRVLSKSSPEEQIKVRADDKLNRIMNTDPDDEDSLLDLIGYLILLRVNRKMNK